MATNFDMSRFFCYKNIQMRTPNYSYNLPVTIGSRKRQKRPNKDLEVHGKVFQHILLKSDF